MKVNINQNENMGKLKIFLGYSAGVGKTYHMLDLARDLKSSGKDVVIGYVENHDRKETRALLDGMEIVPYKQIVYKNITLYEPDISLIIKRNPDIVLLDECAHTNAHSMENSKRYQDIEELLEAGISVYTTLNIQHIKSLNETVRNITNIKVKEIVPDIFLNKANNIELIDIEPSELLDRMSAGKIYNKSKVEEATKNFFTEENLIKLREIALKYMSKFVEDKSEQIVDKENMLLILDGNENINTVVVRAKKLAEFFDCNLDIICISDVVLGKGNYKNFNLYYCKRTEFKEYLYNYIEEKSICYTLISPMRNKLKFIFRVFFLLKNIKSEIILING